jgi:stress-induced morphogen
MVDNSSYVIKTALPSSFFQHHEGAYDDPNGSHVSIEVTSALFEGKRPVQRQQLVYKALWEGMSLHNGRLF